MTEAGRRLKEKHAEVLAETEIHGLVELGTSEMTVRAVTKVQPGTHDGDGERVPPAAEDGLRRGRSRRGSSSWRRDCACGGRGRSE